MSDNDFELSRRKALAALGTIGAASAGAGLGTSAYFSDQETFENNQLTAGELDMHVGWEAHYSDWSPDEDDGLEGDVTMGNAQPIGLPTQNSSLISVNDTADAQQFLNNTETGQYPNGSVTFDDASGMNGCEILPDGTDESPVIIDLDDVKPGDFGEVTFSFALCDNPGFVWMNGELRSADEDGLTEPEADDPDEDGDADSTDPEDVELLDAVQTALWYDDGDNLQEGGGEGGGSGQADIVFVIDASGSIAGDERPAIESEIPSVASDLQSQGVDAQFAIVDYLQGAGIAQDLTANTSDLQDALAGFPAPPAPGSDSASFGESLSNAISFSANNVSFRSGSKRIYVGITDEPDQSTEAEKTAAINEMNSTDSAFLGIASPFDGANESQSRSLIQRLLDETNESQWVDLNQPSGIEGALEDLAEFTGGVVDGEEVFFQGSLRDALAGLSSNGGIALDGDIPAEEGGGSADARNCFSGSGTVHSVGFAWWLPVDHANQIQSDNATFDLGFYTEQCRHNDGSGMNNQEITGDSAGGSDSAVDTSRFVDDSDGRAGS
jgi:predicted ribosomally synthesized peptide with SipW-like signal peptide